MYYLYFDQHFGLSFLEFMKITQFFGFTCGSNTESPNNHFDWLHRSVTEDILEINC